jgi:heme exporter protein D
MQEFFYMGGYAFYVWSAYGLAGVVLLGLAIQSVAWHRRLKRQLREGDFT